jgi:DNA-binding HxlR family transcriptional regulator
MSRFKRSEETRCNVVEVVNLIGGKWKPHILWIIGEAETIRFGELQREIPGITRKVLAKHLDELEHDKLIVRTVYQEVPPRVDYSLTDLGRAIQPVLQTLSDWSEEYMVSGKVVS